MFFSKFLESGEKKTDVTRKLYLMYVWFNLIYLSMNTIWCSRDKINAATESEYQPYKENKEVNPWRPGWSISEMVYSAKKSQYPSKQSNPKSQSGSPCWLVRYWKFQLLWGSGWTLLGTSFNKLLVNMQWVYIC